jgi:hypothetical protein
MLKKDHASKGHSFADEAYETRSRPEQWDRRYPKKDGWEQHVLPYGHCAYFNIHTNVIRFVLKGG